MIASRETPCAECRAEMGRYRSKPSSCFWQRLGPTREKTNRCRPQRSTLAENGGSRSKQPMHRRHEKASSVQAEALLKGCYIRPGILENGFAADRAASSRSCQSPRVRWVGSRAFQATIECRESARKSVLASRETRASPNPGTTLDVLCSEGNAALPPQ